MAKSPKKSWSQRMHAKTVLRDRFGIRVKSSDLAIFAGMIRDGHREWVLFIDKQSNTRSVFRIWWEVHEVWLNAVYDRSRGQIATFLTDEQMEEKYGADWRDRAKPTGPKVEDGVLAPRSVVDAAWPPAHVEPVG